MSEPGVYAYRAEGIMPDVHAALSFIQPEQGSTIPTRIHCLLPKDERYEMDRMFCLSASGLHYRSFRTKSASQGNRPTRQ
jgi:hypothetical protein